MPIGLKALRHPAAQAVRRNVIEQPLTYSEVGASLGEQLPEGYHHTRSAIEIGLGEAAFTAGCAALRAWAAHTYVHIVLTPEHAPLEIGTVVVAEIPMGPVTVVAPCRIVAVVAEQDRFGFAYGTLPGHPERGEESFVVRRGADDVVRFEVAAFSRPGTLFVRLGGPIPRWLQRRTTRRYLEGVRSYVRAQPTS